MQRQLFAGFEHSNVRDRSVIINMDLSQTSIKQKRLGHETWLGLIVTKYYTHITVLHGCLLEFSHRSENLLWKEC